jgi:hypothetical protein
VSVARFVQTPLQFTRPAWQVSWHVPAMQTDPAGQAWPQPAQLAESVSRLTHVPPQFVRPA